MTTTTTINIEDLSDKESIELVSALIEKRVQLGVGYVQDPSTGILTHSILSLKCGDLHFASEAEQLDLPLMPVVTDRETKTLN